MESSDFALATGYLRVLEKRILAGNDIDKVIDAPSGDEALKTISQNSEYDFSILDHPENYKTVLQKEMKRVYEFVLQLMPEPRIVDIVSAKFDFHNVKVLVKSHYLDIDAAPLLMDVTALSSETIRKELFNSDSDILPPHIIEAGQLAIESFENDKDPQKIDMVVDKAMFQYMHHLATGLDNAFIADYIGTAIDFFNIKALLRIKRMKKGPKFLNDALLDDGKTSKKVFEEAYDKPFNVFGEIFYYHYFGDIIRQVMEYFEKHNNFSIVEKLADNYLLKLTHEAQYIAFGPEPIFAYLIAKENEIRQIITLMICKLNNIPTDILKERLRDQYA